MAKANITKFTIDTSQYKFVVANEKVTAKHGWDKDKNEREETQAVDETTKNPLWIVTVNIIDERNKLSDTANVTVAAPTEPKLGFYAELGFENLQLLAMSRKEEFGVSFNFTATGIKNPGHTPTTTSTSSASKKAA